MRKLSAIGVAAVVTLLCLLANPARAEGPCPAGGAFKDGRCEREFKVMVAPDLPEYVLHAVWDPEAVPQAVTVETSNGKGQVQRITGPAEEAADVFAGIETADLNFDGYQDLILKWAIGAKNGADDLWLFDPAARQFYTRKDLQGLESVFDVDPKTKTIKTAGNGSGFGWYWVTAHRMVGGKLAPVEVESQRWLTEPFGYYYRTRERRAGAAMKTTEEAIFTITDSGEPDKYICGPGAPPAACGPILAVIEFTAAEQERDAAAMSKWYADEVVWNGRTRPRADLKKMHERYLAGIADGGYEIEVTGFRQTLDGRGGRAEVEAKVEGNYRDKGSGQEKHFVLQKRWRLRLMADKWLIECEEIAEYLGGTKGKTAAECRLPE